MRMRLNPLPLAVVALVPLAISAGAQAAASRSATPSPGFETGRGDAPMGWTFAQYHGSKATGVWDATAARAGRRSLKIDKTNAPGFATWSSVGGVKPATRYRLSLWHRTQGFHKGTRAVVEFRGQAGRVTDSRNWRLAGSETWKLLQEVLETDLDADAGRVAGARPCRGDVVRRRVARRVGPGARAPAIQPARTGACCSR